MNKHLIYFKDFGEKEGSVSVYVDDNDASIEQFCKDAGIPFKVGYEGIN